MQSTHPQTDSTKPRQLPGNLLKQARERLGLAQKDIAAQLNLQAEMIDALENDASERLPVAAYVRGYIRSYARLVKLDGDMLIGLYEQASIPLPEIIPNIKKPSQASSRDKPVRAITYLITFTLALLLLAWLQSKYIVGRTLDDISNKSETDGHAYPQGQNTGADTTRPTGSVPVEPAAPTGSLSLPPGGAEATESIITETTSADMSAVETAPPEALQTDPAQIAENLTSGEDKLHFMVTRDSWIEVYDTNKTKLYHGLAKSGSELKLSGKAPFSVLLGYAPGVEVRFNDEPFDPMPYSNAGIARFTLGAADR